MSIADLHWPAHLQEFAEQRAAEEGFESADEYVKHLVEKEAQKQKQLALESELIKGINSGPPIQITPEYIEEKKRRLRERRGGDE